MTTLAWITAMTAVGNGIMAGVYFTFSTFVVQALAALGERDGAAGMVSINRVILSSPFMPLFFATTALNVGLAIHAALHWSDPSSRLVLLGAVVYVVGMFVVTAAFNVPLNEELRRAFEAQGATGQLWLRYVRDWTRYNHVRTVASVVGCGVLIVALRG
jgi:uncharacterized membrane protein